VKYLCLTLLLAASCSRPAGRIEAPHPRIVSLIPNATEIVFGLGMGGHMVGATRYCDRPEAAKSIPRVGGILDVSVEAVLAADPDLVIGSSHVLRGHLASMLGRAEVKILPLDFDTAESVIEGIKAIGRAVGRESKAESMVASLKRDLRDLKDRALRNPRIKVLFIAGSNPLVVASRASFLGDLLERMGVENVVGSRAVPYPTWSLEQVLRADPDVLLNGASEAGDIMASLASGGVRAAREGRVVAKVDQAILRPGPGSGRAALGLADEIVKVDAALSGSRRPTR